MKVYEERFQKVHDAWVRWQRDYSIIGEEDTLRVFPGWLPIVEEMIQKLIALGWDRELWDVRTKFCELKVILGDKSWHSAEMEAVVDEAKKKAAVSCEFCGAPHGLKVPMSGNAICQACSDNNKL